MTETWKCPKCERELTATEDNPHYFMCFDGCLQGWTAEELQGIQRFVNILRHNNQRIIIIGINTGVGNKLYWFIREIMNKYGKSEINEL